MEKGDGSVSVTAVSARSVSGSPMNVRKRSDREKRKLDVR
jgi:hypothetical protein